MKAVMTASEAQSFSRYSVANASHVEHLLPCGCKAYEDVFTYNRWKALGYQVQRGEKAIRIPVIKHVDKTDEETGETTQVRLLGHGAVFCRHQVRQTTAQLNPVANPVAPAAMLAPVPAPKPSSAAPSGYVAQAMSTWERV